MRVLHLVGRIDNEASGPSTTVPRLCAALGDQGVLAELFTLAGEEQRTPYRVRVFPRMRAVAPLWYSRRLARALTEEAPSVDFIHNHGLWLGFNLTAGAAARAHSRLLVTSPRGTLSDWALSQSRWLKRTAWRLGQRRLLTAAACVHATSQMELDDVRRVGVRVPVALIPNGVDIPELSAALVGHGRKRLLFLSRLHPTKNVEGLLRAWAIVESRFPEWDLRVVGPVDSNYAAELVKMASNLRRVYFEGPRFGADKAEAYRSSHLFVLPSHSENFGLAVAEALAHGLPVVVGKGAPWAGVVEAGCGWWVDTATNSLASSLTEALGTPEARLRELGAAGRRWMEQDFSWQAIGGRMVKTYHWLLGHSTIPCWVHSSD